VKEAASKMVLEGKRWTAVQPLESSCPHVIKLVGVLVCGGVCVCRVLWVAEEVWLHCWFVW